MLNILPWSEEESIQEHVGDITKTKRGKAEQDSISCLQYLIDYMLKAMNLKNVVCN